MRVEYNSGIGGVSHGYGGSQVANGGPRDRCIGSPDCPFARLLYGRSIVAGAYSLITRQDCGDECTWEDISTFSSRRSIRTFRKELDTAEPRAISYPRFQLHLQTSQISRSCREDEVLGSNSRIGGEGTVIPAGGVLSSSGVGVGKIELGVIWERG